MRKIKTNNIYSDTKEAKKGKKKKNNNKNKENDGDYNEYAVCTESIGETAGTTKRSEWTEDQKERYDRCIEHVKDQDKGD